MRFSRLLARLAPRPPEPPPPPPPVVAPEIDELHRGFPSLEAWRGFLQGHPELEDRAHIEAIVAEARTRGVQSGYLGAVPPEAVEVRGGNYREDLLAAGFNPRQRMVLDLFAEEARAREPRDVRIYAHEAITPFALALRGRYARFLGSEFAATEAERERLFPIPVVDVMRSGFPDACFDVVLSIDVFEHVPDLDAALRDTARILRPDGRLLATFPFLYGTEPSEVRAVQEADGSVRHLAEPEYHGNPVDPDRGSLVFQVPGWDILRRAREAGFTTAVMVFWSSARHALTGAEIAGIFALDARR